MYLLDSDEEFICNDTNDSDGDRLLNCVETNSLVYRGINNTGTDPKNPDTDGDGINDGDEVLGMQAGLNLPAMGLNPLRKNILIEYDWFDDDVGCFAHSHRPSEAVISAVGNAFANAPVVNPDGTTGITIIQDYGQDEDIFNGGNMIDDADGLLESGIFGSEFDDHKNANFAANRNGYFHYVIMPHQYNGGNTYSSGQAELPGNDLIVSLNCYCNNTAYVANTIMHELGHNLGLRHGGFESCLYKPNYNSVMNYKYQLNGVNSGNCDAEPDGILDYSHGNRITIDERDLDEHNGVCGYPLAIDWNANGNIDTSVAFNTNSQVSCKNEHPEEDANGLSILEDYDDWSHINLSLGLSNADGVILSEVVDCLEVPDDQNQSAI